MMAASGHSRVARPAVLSAGLVFLAGAVTLPLMDLGPISLGMALHILAMNVVAPIAAIPLIGRIGSGAMRPGVLALSAVAQLALLWAWHAPAVQLAASGHPAAHFALAALLFLAALTFWTVLLALHARQRWRSVVALLLTGKAACLLGGLLIFAPRDLYGIPGLDLVFCSTGPSSLEDQHLAGLLMITACPLSYVVAGVVVAAQMLFDLEERGPSTASARLAAS
jgi:putative membrane protein